MRKLFGNDSQAKPKTNISKDSKKKYSYTFKILKIYLILYLLAFVVLFVPPLVLHGPEEWSVWLAMGFVGLNIFIALPILIILLIIGLIMDKQGKETIETNTTEQKKLFS